MSTGDWWCCEEDYPNHTKECAMGNYLKGMVEEPAEDKRYIISEVGSLGRPISTYSITESELTRRCLVMCVNYEKTGAVKIDVLLHGEIGPGFAQPGAQPWPSPEDIIRMRHDSKPPTREDWEEFAEHMPDLSFDEKFLKWSIAMRKWLLTMPGIPKEKT
jgi:hypothetical protein